MTTIWALHGNLQHPNVWDELRSALADKSIRLFTPDLYASKAETYPEWTEEFISDVREAPGPRVLIGYSLGGRLAMHAVLAAPDLWQAAIIVGADPGLENPTARQKQLELDEKWAERFSNEDLTTLMDEWDSQAVFAGRTNPQRSIQRDISPRDIAAFFRKFSKGHQEYLLPALSKLKCPPIIFLAGEEDRKYSEIGKLLEENCPAVHFKEISEAAHRVPWEAKEEFYRIVKEAISQP